MTTRLPFSVATASGEDGGFPAGALNDQSPRSQGWVTPKFCSYPQQVVLRLQQPCELTALQILSHQSLVARRLDLYIGNPVPGQTDVAENASYRSIGYLCLDSNERSNFGARELKKVTLSGCAGSYLRVVVHAPHRNAHNVFNQVGIVAVNLLGQPRAAPRLHAPPSLAPIDTGGGARNQMDELEHMMAMDPETAAAIRHVIDVKHQLVARDQFALAKAFKQHEQELGRLGLPIAKLQRSKRDAIAVEDYDLAKQAQQQLQGLRASFQALLSQIDFEGAAAVCAAQPVADSIFQPSGGFQHSPAAQQFALPFVPPHITPSSSPMHGGAGAADAGYRLPTSASSSVDDQPAVAGALPTAVQPRRMPFGSPSPMTEAPGRPQRSPFVTPQKNNVEDLPIGLGF